MLFSFQIQIIHEIVFVSIFPIFAGRVMLWSFMAPGSTSVTTTNSLISITLIGWIPLIFYSIIFRQPFHRFAGVPFLIRVVLWIWALVYVTPGISDVFTSTILHIFIIVHMRTHIWMFYLMYISITYKLFLIC